MQKVCIVIPCYNEANRLPVNDFIGFFNLNSHIHFCFVNDGSIDNTSQILNEQLGAKFDNVSVLYLQNNVGKAEAIRIAVNDCLQKLQCNYIGYFDADLATPLTEIDYLISQIKTNTSFKVAIGARVQRMGVNISRNIVRHYFGRVFATCASYVLHVPIYDTQCGAKIFETELAEKIFATPFISKWLFDVEIVARILKLKHEYPNAIIEVPLRVWSEVKGSKIKLKDVIKIPFQLIKIKGKYNL